VIDPDRLLALALPQRRCSWDERDAMLYALGIGYGSDPLDEADLRFACEHAGLQVAPSFLTVLGWDRSWIPATGIDWPRVVHGEHRIELATALPVRGEAVVHSRITEVLDKGSGALFRLERRLVDAAGGAALGTCTTGFFVRGAGGFAPRAPGTRTVARAPWPGRAADAAEDAQTFPNQALLYRLCGDRNPHHAWPPAAHAGGFERPLLHGLSTFGFAGRAVLRAFGEHQAGRLLALEARFLAPVFPGEALRFSLWRESEGEVLFRGGVPGRDVTAIEGRASVAGANRHDPADTARPGLHAT
jgi:acyl dehydratase